MLAPAWRAIFGMNSGRFMTVSAVDWGIPPADPSKATDDHANRIGLPMAPSTLLKRCVEATSGFLMSHFDDRVGAFRGHYDPAQRQSATPDLTNLIAPLQCLAMYDRTGDPTLLLAARRAADYVYAGHTVSWPMHMWRGAVKDTGEMGGKAWVKYASEMLLLNAALYSRTEEKEYLERAEQNAGFLKLAAHYQFSYTFDLDGQTWDRRGWQSFGRAVEALLVLYGLTGESRRLDQAIAWARHGLRLQARDGGFYLIDNWIYNSDLAANEIRGLTYLFEATRRRRYLRAAVRFADWHLSRQRDDGAWVLARDRDGDAVVDAVGPGDVANIGISLLRLHIVTGARRFLTGAFRALDYSLALQASPGGRYERYLDDPHVRGGYWSWDPPYDWTLCGDQSVHHVRFALFMLDFFASRGEA